MALIHFAQNWEFEVILPTSQHFIFHSLLTTVTYCNDKHFLYELKPTT
jgi:hypothetical protein